MQFNAKLVLGLISTLSLAACSGGGGGENKNYAKSTADLQEIAQNFSRIENSAKTTRNKNVEDVSKTAVNDDPILREKSRRMEQALAQCDVNMVTPTESKPGSPNQEMKFGMTISGNCPVSANYQFAIKAAADQLLMDLGINLKITDPALAAMNDVYGVELKGSLRAKQNQNGSGSATGSLSGYIYSEKFGTVTVNGSLQASGQGDVGSINGVISFNIKGEITELAIRSSGEKTDYIINGKSVTKQEFDEVVKSLSFLGQTVSSDNQDASGF